VRPQFIELKSSDENERVTLAPLGVITGKVVDQYGQPMRGVGIAALTSIVQEGRRQPHTDRTVTTDDLGVYRMWNLTAGKYYVKAMGQGGATLLPGTVTTVRNDVGDSFAPVYSGGGSTMSSATPVELSVGGQAQADFRLKLEAAWRINGVIRNFTRTEQITYSIVDSGEEIVASPERFNPSTGVFQFKDVVAGSYILRAKQQGKTGEVAVRVADADTAPVALTLYPDVEIPVHVRYTNTVAAPPMRAPVDAGGDFVAGDFAGGDVIGEGMAGGCMVSLGSADGSSMDMSEQMSLKLTNVTVGTHRVLFQCFGGYVRSALWGNQDLLADPVLRIGPDSAPPAIEITATHGGGILKGRAGASVPAGGLGILLVPQFAGSIGPVSSMVVPEMGGQFVFNGLAPGSYSLYAFSRVQIEYGDPAFLRSLTGGLNIQVEDDKTQEVVVKDVIP
jgi:hypothetical protein